MDYFCEDQNGTYVVPWEETMSGEDVSNIDAVERLRFIDLQGIWDERYIGLRPEWESARYDDDNLYLCTHDSYPVILRFTFLDGKGKREWEWYAVYERASCHLCFELITCFRVANEREGFNEPVLWG